MRNPIEWVNRFHALSADNAATIAGLILYDLRGYDMQHKAYNTDVENLAHALEAVRRITIVQGNRTNG